jgi:hypothetical protein
MLFILTEADLTGAMADDTTWWPADFDPRAAGVQPANSTQPP